MLLARWRDSKNMKLHRGRILEIYTRWGPQKLAKSNIIYVISLISYMLYLLLYVLYVILYILYIILYILLYFVYFILYIWGLILLKYRILPYIYTPDTPHRGLLCYFGGRECGRPELVVPGVEPPPEKKV